MAHKTGQKSSSNGRDSASKRLGVKLYGGQKVLAGGIIVRQLAALHAIPQFGRVVMLGPPNSGKMGHALEWWLHRLHLDPLVVAQMLAAGHAVAATALAGATIVAAAVALIVKLESTWAPLSGLVMETDSGVLGTITPM